MGSVFRARICDYRQVLRQVVQQFSPKTRALLVAGLAGLVVIVLTWAIGPGLFAVKQDPVRTVTAAVTEPASCADPRPVEKVRFTEAGKPRDAALPACGHDKGEELQVAIPHAAATAGPLTVRIAETYTGYSTMRRSVGLLLVALSSAGGATYAFLLLRGAPSRHRRRVQPV